MNISGWGARLISSVVNYTLNKNLVFRQKGNGRNTALRYALVCVIVICISNLGVWLLGRIGMAGWLAKLLMERGETERAFRYLSVCIADANFYGTRLRSQQVAQLMPTVVDSYLNSVQRSSASSGKLVKVLAAELFDAGEVEAFDELVKAGCVYTELTPEQRHAFAEKCTAVHQKYATTDTAVQILNLIEEAGK